MSRVRGTGLVEVLVASTAALLLMGACLRTVLAQHEIRRREAAEAALRENARRILALAGREIRNAGYDPLPGGPFDGAAEALADARSDRIELLSDHHGPSPTDPPDGLADPASDERVGFRPGSGAPTVIETVGGMALPLTSDVEPSPPGLAFRYFDACGAEIVPGPGGLTAVERTRVRAMTVQLTLTATNDAARTAATLAGIRNRQELPCP